MNFSKTTSYAISVLSHMSDHKDERHSARGLHEELDIPWPYLRQLLTSLSKSGFIKSIQGRNGGFMLQRPADQITLGSIVDSVEGLSIFSSCIMGFKECPFDQSCAMHEVWVETRGNLLRVLNNTTLAQFKQADQ